MRAIRVICLACSSVLALSTFFIGETIACTVIIVGYISNRKPVLMYIITYVLWWNFGPSHWSKVAIPLGLMWYGFNVQISMKHISLCIFQKHWCWPIYWQHFQMNFTKNCFNMRQAIIWTNDDQNTWRVPVPLGLSELNICVITWAHNEFIRLK